MFIRVEERRLGLWLEVISHEFPLDYISIGPSEYRIYANRRYGQGVTRTIFFTNESLTMDNLAIKVSELAYKKGLIQNLTKKENLHVREADRQIPEKVCPSTGKACQHDNGSGNCVCEGESNGYSSETIDVGFASLPDVREKGRTIADEYLKEIESELGLGYV